MNASELIACAMEARKNAYTPYSHFAVGAALLTVDGEVFKGCNIENAAYSPSICAERTVIVKAVSEGKKEFAKIAIVGGPVNGALQEMCPPCGVCRQVIQEFAGHNSDFRIVLGDAPDHYKEFTLGELLPYGFGPDNL